ncbi:glycosyltransferase family 2 protein [Pseudoalteromonas sp. C2R02]|uniref:glycosyltransferase family 2 protein n=1 Tax=Pseudoalteromonas sp. C2R02 TaxID=2841565 RepID=UPI001C084C79|nr:glycosyltransferase family A protein [Pseudoalteromonas sp. C2R02]MBU2969268.1 glycosyltransferase family 2 protein [Pseudoalteromonas sp. C2R02]
MNKLVSIGIVVIGRNEGERLKLCLQSVRKAKCKVVYVDSDSKDGSAEFADSLGISVVRLNDDKPINAAIARNAGFKQITSESPELEFIHFIDADCELNAGWLKHALTVLTDDDKLSAVCGRLREKNVKESIYTQLCDMSWYIRPGIIDSCGGIATIKVDIFKQFNGFNETLIAGEEPEFYSRVREKGYTVRCLDIAMGTHDCAMVSFKQWWMRTVKTGFGFANGSQWGAWNKRQHSILIWVLLIPITILCGSIIEPWLLISALIFPIQILKIGIKSTIPYSFKDKLLDATFCIFAKLPQFVGMVKYQVSRFSKEQNKNIEYKA